MTYYFCESCEDVFGEDEFDQDVPESCPKCYQTALPAEGPEFKNAMEALTAQEVSAVKEDMRYFENSIVTKLRAKKEQKLRESTKSTIVAKGILLPPIRSGQTYPHIVSEITLKTNEYLKVLLQQMVARLERHYFLVDKIEMNEETLSALRILLPDQVENEKIFTYPITLNNEIPVGDIIGSVSTDTETKPRVLRP